MESSGGKVVQNNALFDGETGFYRNEVPFEISETEIYTISGLVTTKSADPEIDGPRYLTDFSFTFVPKPTFQIMVLSPKPDTTIPLHEWINNKLTKKPVAFQVILLDKNGEPLKIDQIITNSSITFWGQLQADDLSDKSYPVLLEPNPLNDVELIGNIPGFEHEGAHSFTVSYDVEDVNRLAYLPVERSVTVDFGVVDTFWTRPSTYQSFKWSFCGLLLIVIVSSLFYRKVFQPNDFGSLMIVWLIAHPRQLFAAINYAPYYTKWQTNNPLEKLIVLCLPLQQPFTIKQAIDRLISEGAVFGQDDVHKILQNSNYFSRCGTGDSWLLRESSHLHILRHKIKQQDRTNLAQHIRNNNAPYQEIVNFMVRAGFEKCKDVPSGFMCQSDKDIWKDCSSLCVQLITGHTLDLQGSQDVVGRIRNVFPDGARDQVVILSIDVPLSPGELYQLYALRHQEKFIVIPLPQSLIVRAKTEQRETQILREQIDIYSGRVDLYDIRSAVSDILAFYGRSGLLTELNKQLIGGQSIVIHGVRKAGKSSLLERLQDEMDWPTAKVDLQGYQAGLAHVYSEIMRGWQAFFRAHFPNIQIETQTDELNIGNFGDQSQFFRRSVDGLLDILGTQPAKPGLLVFLDEADVLLNMAEYVKFAGVLREIAEDRRWKGRFVLLLACNEPLINRLDRLHDQRNPFFSFFIEKPLRPLAPDDTSNMIKSIGGQMGVVYTDEALDLLITSGGGHPFLTRQVCSMTVRDLDRPTQVDIEQVRQSIEHYLRFSHNYFSESLWALESGGPPPAEAHLLTSLAKNYPQTYINLIKDLPSNEHRKYQMALDHLGDQSLLQQFNDEWSFTIPLYRSWIRQYVLNLPD